MVSGRPLRPVRSTAWSDGAVAGTPSSHIKDFADSRRESLVALGCCARQRFIPVGRDVEIWRRHRGLLCAQVVGRSSHAGIEVPGALDRCLENLPTEAVVANEGGHAALAAR